MDSSKEFDECIICLEDLKENIVVLDCKHRYHYYCIQQWFFKKRSLIACNLHFLNAKMPPVSFTKASTATELASDAVARVA